MKLGWLFRRGGGPVRFRCFRCRCGGRRRRQEGWQRVHKVFVIDESWVRVGYGGGGGRRNCPGLCCFLMQCRVIRRYNIALELSMERSGGMSEHDWIGRECRYATEVAGVVVVVLVADHR